MAILDAALRHMRPGAAFYQFTYGGGARWRDPFSIGCDRKQSASAQHLETSSRPLCYRFRSR